MPLDDHSTRDDATTADRSTDRSPTIRLEAESEPTDRSTDRSPSVRADTDAAVTVRPIDRLRRAVRARPVGAFFAIVFAYSWGLFAVLYGVVGPTRLIESRLWIAPFAWGPAIGAATIVHLSGGSVRTWAFERADPRTNLRWYLLAVVAAVLLTNDGSLLAGLVGVELEPTAPVEELLASLAISLCFAGALEEFGWRGFAQPRLQERYDALGAAIVVGLLWGVWHYPWLLVGGAGYGDVSIGAIVGFPIITMLMSIVFAWLYNGSGGVVPVVMLAHAIVNTTPVIDTVGQVPGWVGPISILLSIGVVCVPIVVYGRRYLAPKAPSRSIRKSTRDNRRTE
ncbi:MAG: CPBP family intramembrane glutamic endopeptidase [Halobacteriota archaeon]